MKEGFYDVNLTWRSLIEETIVVVRRQDTEVVVHSHGRISRAFTTVLRTCLPVSHEPRWHVT